MTLVATQTGWAHDPANPDVDRRYVKDQAIPSRFDLTVPDKEHPLWDMPKGSFVQVDSKNYSERR